MAVEWLRPKAGASEPGGGLVEGGAGRNRQLEGITARVDGAAAFPCLNS
jgi:hypothetical protein